MGPPNEVRPSLRKARNTSPGVPAAPGRAPARPAPDRRFDVWSPSLILPARDWLEAYRSLNIDDLNMDDLGSPAQDAASPRRQSGDTLSRLRCVSPRRMSSRTALGPDPGQ